MNEDLQNLLRRVFSVSTDAGYKLRYILTKAICCKKYAEEINLECTLFGNSLPSLFLWKKLPEGPSYWNEIESLLSLQHYYKVRSENQCRRGDYETQ